MYFKYRRFALIDENGGYLVNRLKDCANTVITAELREWRSRAIPLEGEQIQDVAEDLHRQYIDVRYEKTQLWYTKQFRVGGVRDKDDDYHLYITD